MPSFSGFPKQITAKGQVCSDGEMFVTDASNGHTCLLSSLSTYTAFLGVPVRSATGVWSVTLKDSAYKVLVFEVCALTTTGNAIGVVPQKVTADSSGRCVLNWTFCTIGTATPADIAASQTINVYVSYSEVSIA